MEKIIERFIDEAAKGGCFTLLLKYQWVLNAYETNDSDILYGLLVMKSREA